MAFSVEELAYLQRVPNFVAAATCMASTEDMEAVCHLGEVLLEQSGQFPPYQKR